MAGKSELARGSGQGSFSRQGSRVRPMTEENLAKKQALAWWIRLSELQVTNESLRRFGAWRQSPENVAAWRAVEREARERASLIR